MPLDDPRGKKVFPVNAAITKDLPNATYKVIVYFSDWYRLMVFVAWFLKRKRFVMQLSQRSKELQAIDGVITSSHLQLKMNKVTSAFGGQCLIRCPL